MPGFVSVAIRPKFYVETIHCFRKMWFEFCGFDALHV